MADENKTSKKNAELDKTGLTDNMKLDYQGKPVIPGTPASMPDKVKKEMEKTREKLEKFKKAVIKKCPFILSLGIIPPQASEKFDEEVGLTEEEKKEKPMHLVLIIPEEKFKEIGKIKADLIKEAQDIKPKLWLNIITPIDLWNFCLDGKYDIAEAIGMSFPLYDKGLLGALRASQIHKSLCLRKFEKYVASYVIAGSLVRGDTTKTSDVDVFIVIDDTDVKRMPRLELREKLRGIIYSYIMEAEELAGVKNKLNVQIYLLTDFWESVKDANPVIFTFIRDGIPLYDRGTFLPWKLLLRMGRIKPSPEAIDMFMSMGGKVTETVKRRLIDIVVGDIYWGVITPSQALLMLYGLSPPTPKEIVEQMRKIFVEKEKILEKKYIDILENIVVKYYKGYEHQKIKEIKGEEVDKLLKDFEDYIKRLNELREDIEKRAQEKTITQVYTDVFKILGSLFGKKSETQFVKEFEKKLINKGKVEPRFLHVLNELIDCKKKYQSKKKPTKHEIEEVRKNAVQLINSLIEYGQRCELAELQRTKILIVYDNGKKKADLFLTHPAFLIQEGKIKKINENKGIEETSSQEFESVMQQQKGKSGKLSKEIMKILKKELGDFEIIL